MLVVSERLSPSICKLRLTHEVKDWEHNMIRFEKGKPTAIWYSQHSNGEAFTYAAVSKSGLRVSIAPLPPKPLIASPPPLLFP